MVPIHLSTILAHSPTKLISQVARLSSKYGGRGHTILFALSANFPSSRDLQQAVNALTNFNDDEDVGDIHKSFSEKGKGKSKGHILGCFVDPFSSTSFETSSGPHTMSEPLISCSVGIFDSVDCVPFRSRLKGRIQPQVGRWHSFRKKEEDETDQPLGANGLGSNESDADDFCWPQGKYGEVNWEELWNRSASEHSPSPLLSLLPNGLRKTDPSQIETLLTLSSPQPDKLTQTISEYLSSSISTAYAPAYPHSLCLIAAPTHFVTGREVTLLLDGKIYGEGAIGIAFLRREPSEARSRTAFPGVKVLSQPMIVTSREGNMIYELDESNPTRLLLGSVSDAGICSPSSQYSPQSATSFLRGDELFALGVLDANGQISRAYKITAGDPSSRGGSLSLDAPRAPEVGSVVQFLYRPPNAPVEIPASLFPPVKLAADQPSPKQVLGFVTVPELLSSNSFSTTSQDTSVSDPPILENTFLAPSTAGFVVSGHKRQNSSDSDPTWTCSVPGGIAMVEWF